MNVSREQIRAARGLLGITQQELAVAIGMEPASLSRFEKGIQRDVSAATAKGLFDFFDNRNIMFLENNGVAFKPMQSIHTFHGQEGFRALMDDVYQTARDIGGEIAILNGSPFLFLEYLGADWYKKHAERMFEIKDNINFRIVAEKKGGQIARSFAQYRWIKPRDFHNQSVYIYGTKVAFINFAGDEISIDVIERMNMAVTFSIIFDIVWDSLEEKI